MIKIKHLELSLNNLVLLLKLLLKSFNWVHISIIFFGDILIWDQYTNRDLLVRSTDDQKFNI